MGPSPALACTPPAAVLPPPLSEPRLAACPRVVKDALPTMHAGVGKAVRNVNNIIGPALVGMDPLQQKEIDDKMVQV